MTFSPRNCQSRHSILYVNWVRACRTNFHGYWSRDDQTRPLFERTNCQFLKIITFCPKSESQKNDLFSPKLSIATFHLVRELGPGLPDKFSWLRVTRRPNSTPVWAYELSISQNNYILSQVRIQKNDLFSPKLSIATFHLVRELGPGLPDKFAWLRVTRRPNSTPVWAYELSISQNNYILSQVRISKKWPFLPETVNRDIPCCTWTRCGPDEQICMVAGHATTKLDPCFSVRNVNFSK